jgi:outer membrane protein TolC
MKHPSNFSERGYHMRSNAVITILLIFVLFSATVRGDEKPLNLKEAIGIALEHNNEVRAFRNSLEAQREDIGIARSSLLPRVTFEERFLRTTNPTYAFMSKLNQQRFEAQDFAISSLNSPNPTNDFQTTFAFEQPLFVKNAYIGLDMAKTEYSAKNEDYKRKKEEVAVRVVEAYLAVVSAREFARVGQEAVKDAKEHLRMAELRNKAGLGLYSDVLRASTAVTETEQKLVSAQKNLAVAKRALGLLLGRDASMEIVSETPEFPLLGIEYYTTASLSRNDVRSLELRSENAKKDMKLAEAGYFPVVALGGSYQLNDPDKPFGSSGESWSVMAFLRWDLFNGLKREHERSKAKYKVSETEEYLQGVKKAVSFKVFSAYLSVEEARKNLELSGAALKSAEEGTRLVTVRFEKALSPLVDLLDAQVSLDHSRASVVARENEYRMAIATLSYESGTLLKDLHID